MKLKVWLLAILLTLGSLNISLAALEPPIVSLSTNGVRVDITWTAVAGATGYTLLYAPSPYAGPQTIVSKDTGTKTSISANLWDGASYYVAVKAYNTQETSGYSNIELFKMGYSDDDNDGFTELQGDCNDSDSTIYPSATEVCADGIDQNCNGSIDEGCPQHNSFIIPDTGQTTCFNSSGAEISCSGTGQDGEFTINAMSYTDNGNGTVTDNVTGLIWQKDDGFIGYNWSDAVSYCTNLTLGGSSNWRLPSINELMSLMNYGVYSPNLDYVFSGAHENIYWSSTTIPSDPNSAFNMYFHSGDIFVNSKSIDQFLVLCVR